MTRSYEDDGNALTRHERMKRYNRDAAHELNEKRDAIRNSDFDVAEEARQLRALNNQYKADVLRLSLQ